MVASAAVSTSVVLWWQPRVEADAPPRSGAVAARITELADRLAALEEATGRRSAPRVVEAEVTRRAPAAAGVADTGSASERVVASGGNAAVLREFEARLARLEGFEQERQEEIQRREAERERRRQERRQRIARAPQTILDPSQPVRAKIEAWEDLRRTDGEGWTDAVVAEMVRHGRGSESARVREQVWRNADVDRAHPLLKAPLLDAALGDPSSEVREEAAETLENYVDDPAVVAALEQIVASDASEEVRREARRALARRRR